MKERTKLSEIDDCQAKTKKNHKITKTTLTQNKIPQQKVH